MAIWGHRMDTNMDIAEKLIHTLIAQQKTICTAESCTGGLISATLTGISGASAVFEQAFITYSNQAKQDMIGVSPTTLNTYGAVSAQTAQQMAQGALKTANADIAIACTGIAGPSGGTPEKPVGLVYIGIASKGGKPHIYKKNYVGDRLSVRTQTTQDGLYHALQVLIAFE